MTMKHQWLHGIISAVLAIGVTAASPAQAADAVSFNLSWLPQGSQSGVFAAAANGYYAEANLQVEIVRGFGSVRTVNEVDQGQFTFAFGNALGVLANRSNKGQARMIAMIETENPAGICWIEGKHTIRTPADLKGLTMGAGSGSPVPLVLPIWLTRNGLPPDAIRLIQMQAGVIDISLVEGKIDINECWRASNLPVLRDLAAKNGQKVGRLQYGDYKMDIYGNGIVASDKMIKEKPDLVGRFIKATLKGFAFAKENPAGAADTIMKRYPTLDRNIVLEQVRDENLLMEAKAGQAPGWIDAAKMERTREFLSTAHKIGPEITTADLYTNQFVTMR